MRKLLFALSAPLLLLQGKVVRARTPRLPEPPGRRHNIPQGGAAPLGLLLIGDSAIAGVGCETQEDAFSGRLIGLLAEKYQLHWQLMARSSLTCAQVLAMLKETDLRLTQVDTVVISVGVNDVTQRTSLVQWRRDLEALTDYLQSLGAKHILYTALPPMERFPALPQPLRWFLGRQAHDLNRELAAHCDQQQSTELLLPDFPFEARFVARDGYHPSHVAAELWAQRAAALLQQRRD
ncbi:SGNH/GDSL hydrolase family protein [Pseudidiomarina insulisalsae]|uniref:SGNH hydrolase-type esterase domain-containing protein n=1 Tax=Pseudidiomarina insulisalsae TaxID=575789 RepID=A0A432YQ29_9GAMM|nr:SGNH/GDSL hydrolase family protein [Pseudidiomarina insulisalsae]RUO63137.1 hypothetical protein CWI71_02630 [Pseudidiomarina insulisalsae]